MVSIKRRLCFCSLQVFALLIASASALYAQTPDTKSKPTGSISGRVTIGDKPAPGIIVTASGQNFSIVGGQATSDAEGNYRINGLPAGQINVSPIAPLYTVPSNSMYVQGRVVNLSTNEAAEGVDFKLTRGGVITGRITDADGRPAIEERITLMSVDENGAPARGMTYGRAVNFLMYQTDDRGVYRIFGLAPGRYKVSVGDEMSRGSSRGSFPRTFYPDATDVARASIVEVTSGGEAKDIDIKLGRRSQTYAVSGRVIDADTNKPLPGIQFSFGMIQQNQGQSYVGSSSGPGTPTNSQGEFRVEGLTPGRYVFMVSSPNFNPLASGPKFYSDPVPFEVLDSDVTNLEVKARKGLTISGVIVPDGITDKNALARLSGLMVMASVDPVQPAVRVYQSGSAAKVNPDRSFVLEGLSPGKVSLSVGAYSGPESQGFSLTRIERNGVAQANAIDLAAGQSLSGVAVYVAYGSGVVLGQVKVEGGTLAGDAVLFVTLQRQGENTGWMGSQVDSRGRFIVKGIAPGNYEVMLQIMTLGAQTPMPRGFPRLQKQAVTVTENAEIEVTFTLDLSGKERP